MELQRTRPGVDDDDRTATYAVVVTACGFLTFGLLPDGFPFLVRLTMMAATQMAVGEAL